MFGCRSQIHVLDTLREKLDPKTKECIFLGYAEGVKVGVLEHVAIGQRFVLCDAVVGSMRLNSKPIAGGSLAYHGKNKPTEVSSEQSKDDLYKTESPSPTSKGSSTYTHEIYDNPFMGYEEMPIRRPKEPPIRFMHKWTLTTQIEDELKPLTVTKASRSVHWREAMEREYKSLVYNNTQELVPLPLNRTIVSGK